MTLLVRLFPAKGATLQHINRGYILAPMKGHPIKRVTFPPCKIVNGALKAGVYFSGKVLFFLNTTTSTVREENKGMKLEHE